MMPANASEPGSSAVRGKGLLCAVNGTVFQVIVFKSLISIGGEGLRRNSNRGDKKSLASAIEAVRSDLDKWPAAADWGETFLRD